MGILMALIRLVGDLLQSRADQALEILALRQQLAMFKAKLPQPKPGPLDKAFWVALSRCWSKWKSALHVVTPDTVVKWHRQGFMLFWRWLSWWRARPDVRRVPMDVRETIRRLARENPRWGAPRMPDASAPPLPTGRPWPTPTGSAWRSWPPTGAPSPRKACWPRGSTSRSPA